MKNIIDKQELHKDLIYRYTIALLIIAALVTSTYFILHKALKESSNTGEIVNISGKQRMLSQHIALDIHRINNKYILNTNINSYALNILNLHTKEMLESNKRLSTGKLTVDNSYELSDVIKDMYFGEMNLASRVEKYVTTAQKLLNSHEDIENIVKRIDYLSEPLLVDLNKVVLQYQREGEHKLNKMSLIETFVWITAIITLLLEVIFIFQPISRKMSELEVQKNAVLEHLEHTVEIRTMHLEKAKEKLENLAYHDSLTGLKNRMNLELDTEKLIEQYNNHHAPFAVLMFDIDFFKAVNDQFGHDIGDEVLQKISSILTTSVRENDNVYRAGGEEFVVSLSRIEHSDALAIAQKISKRVQEHIFKVDDKEFTKTISCGLFHSSLVKSDSVREILKAIDIALYTSKTNGRNKITEVESLVIPEAENISTQKMVMRFSDRKFSNVIDVTISGDQVCGLSAKEILLDANIFLGKIHPDDKILLEKLPKDEINIEKPFITTIRIFSDNSNISIYRVSVYDEKDSCVVSFEESIYIAQKVSDATLIQNFQSMLENTNDFIYFKDRHHVFTAGSKTLVSVTSVVSRDQLIGKTDYDVFSNELADAYFTLERDVFDGNLKVAHEVQPFSNTDGTEGYVDNRKYPIYNSSNEIIGLFGIARIIQKS